MDNGRKTRDLIELGRALQEFAEKRDWLKFHTPKNLAMALAAEAGELLEIYQWLSPEESNDLPDSKCQDLADELGDILIYLVRLSDIVGIDLVAAAEAKLEKNKRKYPVDRVKGDARKYTEY